MSDRYCVMGNPVEHSKSPWIHARFARLTGQDIDYGKRLVLPGEFAQAVQSFRAEGGRGCNVTLPFKFEAGALAARCSERAALAGAANVLRFDDPEDRRRWSADNTDGAGLVRDITVNLAHPLRGTRILLLGAGGAAHGVCGPLLDEAPASLAIANRTVEKAIELREQFSSAKGAAELTALGYDALAGREFDVVINATSAGLSGAMPALPAGLFAPAALAYDMVYGKRTPFLEVALNDGARATDGLGMLVEQAAESFFVWRGVRPRTASVIERLRSEG